jgi:hypothetical protein
MKKYKRGDKHPTKDLIFYQYHHPFYKKTEGEVWYSPEEYRKKVENHRKSTEKHRLKNPLTFMTVNTLQRGKKYKENDIDISFIEDLWSKQRGKCFWFNIDMSLDKVSKRYSRNPLKVTIDRLDNSKGYTRDNIVLCSYAANCGRANCTVKDWEKIIKLIKDGLSKIK